MTDRDFDCPELRPTDKVRESCQKAIKEAKEDLFVEACQTLNKATRTFKHGNEQQKQCLSGCQKFINEWREERKSQLIESIKQALAQEPVDDNALEELEKQVDDYLRILDNLDADEANNLRWQWKERCDKVARQLAQSKPDRTDFEKLVYEAGPHLKRRHYKKAADAIEAAEKLAVDKAQKDKCTELRRRLKKARDQKAEQQRQAAQEKLAQQLQNARDLADQDQFGEALAALSDAKTWRYVDKEQIIAAEAKIQTRRDQMVLELMGELEGLLAKPAVCLTRLQAKRGKEILAKLRKIHPAPATLEKLVRRWQDQVAQQQDKQAEIQQAADTYAAEAEQGQFGLLVHYLQESMQKGEKMLPYYRRSRTGRLVCIGFKPAQEAVDRAVKLATQHANKQARQCLQEAQKNQMENAQKWAEQGLQYEFLSKEIRTKLETYQQALELSQKAVGQTSSNNWERWDQAIDWLQEALKLAPRLQAVQQAREYFKTQLEAFLWKLKETAMRLKDKDRTVAENLARQILDLVNKFPEADPKGEASQEACDILKQCEQDM